MKKNILFLFSFLLLARNAVSQSFIKTITDSLTNNYPEEFIKTNDGNYLTIIANSTGTIIQKIDNSGNTVWAKKILGRSYIAQKNNAGGYYLAGADNASVPYDDLFLVKTNGVGTEIWTKKFRFPGNSSNQIISLGQIVVGPNDEAYVGLINLTWLNATRDQACILKIDSTGNVVWQKNFGTGYQYHDGFSRMYLSPDSNIYVLGYRQYALSTGNDVPTLSKITSNGTLVYTKTLPSILGNYYDLEFSNSGKMYLTGSIGSGFLNSIIKLLFAPITDTTTVLKFKTYSSPAYKLISAGAAFDVNSNLVLGGYAIDSGTVNQFGHAFRMSIDTMGNGIFAKIYADSLSVFRQTFENNISEAVLASKLTGAYNQLVLFKDEDNGQLCNINASIIQDSISLALGSPSIDTLSFVINGTNETTIISNQTFFTHVDLCNPTGLHKIDEVGLLTVFPNPTSGQINIINPAAGNAELVIEVYNSTGKKIIGEQLKNKNGSFTISLNKYAAGVYFIRVTDAGKTWTSKIVIEQ